MEAPLQHYVIGSGGEIPHPILPEQWKTFEDMAICNRHYVEITDKEDLTIL
jgi:hypothetical protein